MNTQEQPVTALVAEAQRLGTSCPAYFGPP